MALSDVTPSGIHEAIAEFDRVGREAFLAQATTGPAKNYYLEIGGKRYDARAVVEHAHRLSKFAEEFSGGEKSIADRLRVLGFEVRFLRNPSWTRDEIILVCRLVLEKGWRTVAQEDSKAIALSGLLQTTAIHPVEGRGADFRNPAGVERKSNDLVTRTRNFTGQRTNGNRLDELVVKAFEADPDKMLGEASAVEQALRRWSDDAFTIPDPDTEDYAGEEGGVRLREHLHRERDPKLKRRKIGQAKKNGTPIACEACGFDFHKTYGSRGLDYIECHHRTPLHVTGPVRTHMEDLALICSNCHRMIHRTTPWLSVEELAGLLAGP